MYTPHRGRDGRPLSSIAIADDHRLQVLFDVQFEFLKICPRALAHVENPVSKAWPTLPPVKQALQLGWQMVRGDHCRMANELDDGRWWSQKPSWYVVANILVDDGQLKTWRCEEVRGCPFRSAKNPSLHRVVIRNKKGLQRRGQVHQPVEMERSRIPLGVFQRLWQAHLAWRRTRQAQPDEEWKVPASVVPRKVAKVAGRLLSMGTAIGPACRLMSRELFRALHAGNDFDWDSPVPGTVGLVQELCWVASHLAQWNRVGMPIWVDEGVVDLVLTQDSSPSHVGFRWSSPSGEPDRDASVPLTAKE